MGYFSYFSLVIHWAYSFLKHFFCLRNIECYHIKIQNEDQSVEYEEYYKGYLILGLKVFFFIINKDLSFKFINDIQ